MIGFKSVLAHDVEATFLNPDEFGEVVNVDGTDIIAVMADATKNAATATGFTPDYYPTLPTRDVTLWARTEDIPSEIAQGGSCKVNGELCTVFARHDGLGGMTRIELQRNGY